jgi:DNA repair photolyase
MIEEVQARTLLSKVKQPDPWFGLTYNMNLYRGCQHQCIYCDSRSECYQIKDFTHDVLVKVNAPELLNKELSHKRTKGTIGTGSMNDPYMPLEAERRLTVRALEVIAHYGFPVHILTKSNLVLRDIDILKRISRVYAAVSFTITTADDDLGRKLEPGAAPVSERFKAMEALTSAGIYTGVLMMPVLPFLEDSEENIRSIVSRAASYGAQYILPCFGVTLRGRQREYFLTRVDSLSPGMRAKYESTFGQRYLCESPNTAYLKHLFVELCAKYAIDILIQQYRPVPIASQLSLDLP